MPHILLTGAGFSRNWGGLLANEAFEYLLGCPQADMDLRQFLWEVKNRGGGFEDALTQLQGAYDAEFSPQIEQNLRNLTSAVYTMFLDMSIGFAGRQFEPQNKSVGMMVGAFLSQFDAIFTLNQDTLLEQKYFGNVIGENTAIVTPLVSRRPHQNGGWGVSQRVFLCKLLILTTSVSSQISCPTSNSMDHAIGFMTSATSYSF